MKNYKCIFKFYTKQNRIYGYKLESEDGDVKDYLADKLKNEIINNKITVTNLKLTSNNRLISVKKSKEI